LITAVNNNTHKLIFLSHFLTEIDTKIKQSSSLSSSQEHSRRPPHLSIFLHTTSKENPKSICFFTIVSGLLVIN
jgi:hypothetical protein